MKNFSNKKSVAERGGLMIEALAMLGLIAVVTPTMYKKSAERTMEVEDINTATTIRTIMGAAEAYMASNYTDIMRVMEEEEHQQQDGDQTIGVLDVPESELLPYLPYKYTANNALYNYRTPTVRIVRSGDNLTAFALFPAKVEDGIGQERTVRIASLIGSNGGYVSKGSDNKISAHGVGGIWNLDDTQYSNVFQKSDGSGVEAANNYSIMVSSADVVNSSTGNGGGGDHPEFLLRYKKEGEEWRNAMRTDLYMGQGPVYENDGSMVSSELSSIRNINSLIVGTTRNENTAEKALSGYVADNNATSNDNGVDETNKKIKDQYGLYIVGSGTDGSGNGNAYINGTLLAAGNRLWASDNTLKYTGTNLTFDGVNFKLGRIEDDKYIAEGHVSSGEGDNATGDSLNIMKDLIEVNDEGGLGNYKKGTGENAKGTAKVAINTGDTIPEGVAAPSYSSADAQPNFGVDIDGNMVVEGVLAAGQLDVNKIRTSSISVGSTNIDDAYKWMDVDDTGVHVHEPAEDGYKGTQIESQSGKIAMRVGSSNAITVEEGKVKEEGKLNSTATAQIVMDTTNGIMAKTNGADLILENSAVGIQMPSGTSTINIGNIDNDNDKVSNSKADSYNVNVEPGAEFNVKSGNMRVKNGEVSVFAVRGKNGSEDGGTQGMDGMLINSNVPSVNNTTKNIEYDVAARGNAVFADKNDSVRYLSMGENPDTRAAVNIMNGVSGSSDSEARGIVYVDMDRNYSAAYFKGLDGDTSSNSSTQSANTGTDYIINDESSSVDGRKVSAGSIYIRKGLIDIIPDKGHVGHGLESEKDANGNVTSYSYDQNGYTANDGTGVIRASRFVANNVDYAGKPIKVPDFYHKARTLDGVNTTTYDAYNGDYKNRYDTYMVNPAYTSVMNDIKLVSRGGARLSDILPTFITKGIYTAVNGAPEQAYRGGTYDKGHAKAVGGLNLKVRGTLYLKGSGCPDGASACLNIARNYSDDGSLGNHAPASPIIGSIPAPQCPPGYMRVIQITPATIRMAEAGRFRNIKDGTDQTFAGLKINVDDFANPSNDSDATDMASMSSANTTKKIYDLYNQADSYGSAGETDDNKNVNTEHLQIGSTDNVDFAFKGYDEKDCKTWNSNNTKCIEYNGESGFTTISDNKKTELMSIELATPRKGVGDNTLVDGGEYTNQANRIDRDYDSESDAEKELTGIWREGRSHSDYDNNEGNVITHKLHFKNAGLHFGTTGTNQEAVASENLSFDEMEGGSHSAPGVVHTVHDQIDLSGARLVVNSIRNVHIARRGDDTGENVYMLTMPKGGMEPLTFQKSTWLKTDAIPLYWGEKSSNYDYDNNHPYTAGWAILMGFIYPKTAYSQVLTALGFGDTYHKLTSPRYQGVQSIAGLNGQNQNQNSDDDSQVFYWNVFPVERNSLEAYISTYCYFEESDSYGRYERDYGDFPMIDRINSYTENYKPTGENEAYRKKLNDPSMKYDELW